MEMSILRQQAMAYYWALPPAQREAAVAFFEALDTDRSGTISIEELTAFLSSQGVYSTSYRKLFDELDIDKNGSLDFSEIVTFFYILIFYPTTLGIYPNQGYQQYPPAQSSMALAASTRPIYDGNSDRAVVVAQRGRRYDRVMQHVQTFTAVCAAGSAVTSAMNYCSIM